MRDTTLANPASVLASEANASSVGAASAAPTNAGRSPPQAGFTLVEMIVSITLVGLLAVVAVPMLRTPMSAYMDAANRADITAEMDATVAKMRDDLAQAVPNSVRVRRVGVRYYLEYLPMKTMGRYRAAAPATPIPLSCPAACAAAGDNDDLTFSTCNEGCFTSLGSLPPSPTGATPAPGDWVIVNPIATTTVPGTPGTLNQDPYFGGTATPANGVKAVLQTLTSMATGSVITMTPHRFPPLPVTPEPTWPPLMKSRQFYIAGNPVSYECNPTTRRVTRYDGYAMAAVQPVAFPAGSGAPLATLVGGCSITHSPTGAAGRGGGGVVSVWLQFSLPSGTTAPEIVESFSVISLREPA